MNETELFWSLISMNHIRVKRMNFVIACLRPSQTTKLGIFTGSRAVYGKEMYKKLPCQAIAYLTFLVAAASLTSPLLYLPFSF